MALRSLNFIELCAGVGGLGLGVHIARPDSRCVAYVEREAFAASTLVGRMDEGSLVPAPIWSDVGTFDARRWRGTVDCVVSGDPCQPNSVAGKGLGAADDRFLIEHVVRIFDESGACRLFRENVTGNAIGQLAAILPLLQGLGCRVAAGIFRASDMGASHQRDRLFIMADRPRERPRKEGQFRRDEPAPRLARCRGNVGDAAGETLADAADGGRPAQGDEGIAPANARQRDAALVAGIPFAFAPADQRWANIIADAPSLKPAVCRMADGLAYRVDRLRACGNGVVPLAAAYAWATLDATLAEASAGTDYLKWVA